ncbi:hypothetical protein D9M68_668850 [compost metagenome]
MGLVHVDLVGLRLDGLEFLDEAAEAIGVFTGLRQLLQHGQGGLRLLLRLLGIAGDQRRTGANLERLGLAIGCLTATAQVGQCFAVALLGL